MLANSIWETKRIGTKRLAPRNLYLACLICWRKINKPCITNSRPALQGTDFYLGRIKFLHVERPYGVCVIIGLSLEFSTKYFLLKMSNIFTWEIFMKTIFFKSSETLAQLFFFEFWLKKIEFFFCDFWEDIQH